MWTPIITALISVAASGIPVVAARLWQYLGSQIQLTAQQQLSEAARRAAGAILDDLAHSDATLTAVNGLKEAAIDASVTALMGVMSESIAKLGGQRSDVERMIRGEIGKLQAGH